MSGFLFVEISSPEMLFDKKVRRGGRLIASRGIEFLPENPSLSIFTLLINERLLVTLAEILKTCN